MLPFFSPKMMPDNWVDGLIFILFSSQLEKM